MDGNGHNPTQKGPLSKLVLTIELDQLTGQVTVTAMPSLPVMSYGMLEIGRQIIQKWVQEQTSDNRIVHPNSMPFMKPA